MRYRMQIELGSRKSRCGKVNRVNFGIFRDFVRASKGFVDRQCLLEHHQTQPLIRTTLSKASYNLFNGSETVSRLKS